MKLLGQAKSINVRKVLWCCEELGLSLDREDWGGETRPTSDPQFLTLNPKGLVPVLVDGDRVLTESNAICRYLVTIQGRDDLLPATPFDRAVVDAWMDWQIGELNTAWRPAFMGLVRRHPDFTDLEDRQNSINTWNSLMVLLDTRLGQTDAYVCGDHFTLADIVLALSTNRWEMTPMAHPTLPALTAWMDRLSARPGFTLYCRNGIA